MAISYGDLVLEPSTANRRQTLGSATFVGAVFVAGAAFGGGMVPALVTAAIVVVGLAALLAYLSRARIIVNPETVTVSGLIFSKHRSRAQVASVVRAALIPVKGPIHENVFLLDRDGNVVLRVYAQNYDPADIDQLLDHLDVPWSRPDRPVTAKELCESFPGLVRWHERRPFMFAFAVAGSFMLVMMIVAIWIGMTHLGI